MLTGNPAAVDEFLSHRAAASADLWSRLTGCSAATLSWALVTMGAVACLVELVLGAGFVGWSGAVVGAIYASQVQRVHRLRARSTASGTRPAELVQLAEQSRLPRLSWAALATIVPFLAFPTAGLSAARFGCWSLLLYVLWIEDDHQGPSHARPVAKAWAASVR